MSQGQSWAVSTESRRVLEPKTWYYLALLLWFHLIPDFAGKETITDQVKQISLGELVGD